MKKNNAHYKETAILAFGEIIVCALVVLGFFVSNLIFETGFTYRIFTGALLGAVVSVANFFGLSYSVNRAVDRFIELRGSREMSEEEALKFTAEHSMRIQNSIRTSFIIRITTMLAALVLAFVLDWFAPLATAIPLLLYRPILIVGEALRRRTNKIPDPANFIIYNNEDFAVADGADGESIAEPSAQDEKESDEQ